jgi:tRNA (cmo5U34)-methyltransferase
MVADPSGWSEADSAHFLTTASYIVPERAFLYSLIGALIPPSDDPMTLIELCCGDGTLAATLLRRFPSCTLLAYDGSARMRGRARESLAPFGDRAKVAAFDLNATDWRRGTAMAHAIVSSLCIHHLHHDEKKKLFADLFRLLQPNGVLLIADIIQPATPHATAVAAQQWDESVRAQAAARGKSELFEAFTADQWNIFRYPDPADRPAPIWSQLRWLKAAGFAAVDVYWSHAGHAVFGGHKRSSDDG